MKQMKLFALSLLLFPSFANAAKTVVKVSEKLTFAYKIDNGELMMTDMIGPADVTFAVNRNATYTFYEVAPWSGAVTPVDEPWTVTGEGETVDEAHEAKVEIDTRTVKEVDGLAGAVTVDLTYSGDRWCETNDVGATIAFSAEGESARTLARGLMGDGTVPWNLKFSGTYVFTHTAGGTTETATIKAVGFPGSLENPWKVGAADGSAVTAYVKDGYLHLAGAGEVMAFTDAAPWEEYALQVSPLAGAVLPRTVTVPASVVPTLPISVLGGDPAGGISPAEFERIDIVGGKAYLGVSVCTNGDLTAETESWGAAKLDPTAIEQAEDGKGLVIPVPATSEKGFMILKSKGK